MFNNILGNDNIKELLTNAVKNKKASHSYMFVGKEGIKQKEITLVTHMKCLIMKL